MHIDNVDLEHFPTNEVAQRLLTYVTRGWYDKSYVGKWIYEVIGLELETASRRISEARSRHFRKQLHGECIFTSLCMEYLSTEQKTLMIAEKQS